MKVEKEVSHCSTPNIPSCSSMSSHSHDEEGSCI